MDISETFDVKMRALKAYETQFPASKERVFRMVEGLNGMLGTSAGFQFGEMLVTPTTLGISDLMHTLALNES